MSLRLLCDQCVPAEIAAHLRQHGHEVFLLHEHLPVRSPDSQVIAKAQDLNAILVSLNGDFPTSLLIRHPNIWAFSPFSFTTTRK